VPQIRYMTGSVSQGFPDRVAFERDIGLMIQPRTAYEEQLQRFPFWAADNGAFTTHKGGFSARRFRKMLDHPELVRRRGDCWFVAVPDSVSVSHDHRPVVDVIGTLAKFEPWAEEIRARGFRTALVAQNGLDSMLDLVAWPLVDVLFIGGDTPWKESDEAVQCAAVALGMGKGVHMGRVNSFRRLKLAARMRAHTADGTFLRFAPDINLPRMLRWLDKVNRGVQLDLVPQ
jgi:hypothetical protein